MSHVPLTNLLNKLIQQRGDPSLNYEILIEQNINNEYLFHVNLQYKSYIIMSKCKDKDNIKQQVARNLYQTLINESEKTNQHDQQNFISNNCKKFALKTNFMSKIYGITNKNLIRRFFLLFFHPFFIYT